MPKKRTRKTRPATERIDDLRLLLRAHIVQVADENDDRKASRKSGERPDWRGWPSTVLALDFETTTDATQRLLFGSYRFTKWLPNHKLYVVREGLVYADDL